MGAFLCCCCKNKVDVKVEAPASEPVPEQAIQRVSHRAGTPAEQATPTKDDLTMLAAARRWERSQPAEQAPILRQQHRGPEGEVLDRVALLTKIFRAMDSNDDGHVVWVEFTRNVGSLVMRKWFTHMNDNHDDGMLNLQDWLSGMLQLGDSLSDEEFEAELCSTMTKGLGQIIDGTNALDPTTPISPGRVSPTVPRSLKSMTRL